MNYKEHWETIYNTKDTTQVTWYQEFPSTSLNFISEFNIPKTAKIIDVGGGDSNLAACLLEMGFQNIYVLDISETAIEKNKLKLGKNASKINWLVSDILNFETDETFDFWHDRATFHFLTQEEEINKYLTIAKKRVKKDGILTLGTFSDKGPKKCSGIEIKQYSENDMSTKVREYFNKIKCVESIHLTPSNNEQNFIFCSFLSK